ncbi:hypothetical protein QBC32DRAFT_401523 [Pseudoneurospora amorphoporcata]|uniref:Uncharacterized protein n=1 Tax=Pseudoneurospora amorphoporcata TaxID=241081 RepID=A0AAN6SBH5_9PEZI|nr:hypothetical protein QBC32DRAFT_401523 [Pseudoneurospora amorphoporcata]
MDTTTKEVVQKLAELNVDPRVQPPIQEPSFIPKRTSSLSHSDPLRLSFNASRLVDQSHTPFGPASQAGLLTQSTKPEAIAGLESSKNIIPLRKPFKNISSNIANSLARSGKTTSGITKCRDKMRRGVDKFLRREPYKAPSKGLKHWVKENERRHERRTMRSQTGVAISEGLRKRFGLKREGATLGVIKEEEEEKEDTVMAG